MKFGIFITSLLLMFLVIFSVFRSDSGVTKNDLISPTPQVAGISSVKDIVTGNEMIDGINEYRISKGVSPLKIDTELVKIATSRAEDMTSNQYYSHTMPNGKIFSSLFDEQKNFSCENLDMSSVSDEKQIINDWLNSSPHEKCLNNSRAEFAGVYLREFTNYPNGDKQFVAVLILSSN